MIIGPDSICQCPQCKGLIRIFSLLSGNSFGGVRWTDGKEFLPMLPTAGMSPLCKCPHCSALVWDSELTEIGIIEHDGTSRWARSILEARPGWRPPFSSQNDDDLEGWSFEDSVAPVPDFSSALWVQSPSWRDHLDFISRGVDSPMMERYFRLHVWHGANDARRDTKVAAPLCAEEIANLERLAEMMDERDDDHRLLKVEIMRELGRFAEAEALLARGFPRRLRETANFIRELNDRGEVRVRQLVHSPPRVDFSGAPSMLFPPFIDADEPENVNTRLDRRGYPLMILDQRQRQNIFKRLRHHTGVGFGLSEFFRTYREALLYVPLHPLAKDNKDDYRHRLKLLLKLFEHASDTLALKPKMEFESSLRALHESIIVRLRDDVRDGLIDFDRIDAEAHAELFSSSGICHRSRVLITTREATAEDKSEYEYLVSHPAAACIVWLARRLQEHWEVCMPDDDGSRYLHIIARSAAAFLRESNADQVAGPLDRSAWCCQVIERLLHELKPKRHTPLPRR